MKRFASASPFYFALAVFAASSNAVESTLQTLNYQQCELEAFSALTIARNGMHLKATRDSQLATPGSTDAQLATINELFDEIERTGSKDHGGFAARKFYDCTTRLRVPVAPSLSGTSVCLARQDLLFFVTSDRLKGMPQEQALVRIKRLLESSSKTTYPDTLVEQLVPMVYRSSTPDDDFLLRQIVFQSCLFPSEWKSHVEALQPATR